MFFFLIYIKYRDYKTRQDYLPNRDKWLRKHLRNMDSERLRNDTLGFMGNGSEYFLPPFPAEWGHLIDCKSGVCVRKPRV